MFATINSTCNGEHKHTNEQSGDCNLNSNNLDRPKLNSIHTNHVCTMVYSSAQILS